MTAELAGLACRELIIVVPATATAALLRHLDATLAGLGGNGVQIRVLVTPSAGSRCTVRIGPNTVPSIDFRIAPAPVQELVIVDGRTALVGAADGTAPTSDTAIIGSLYALFNSVWELSSTVHATGRTTPDLDSEVLALLCGGWTDEVAARRLGISVRTYRRYVAKIMQDVGATSRFQAGVLAAERGLVQALYSG